jgi:hypothetical protein
MGYNIFKQLKVGDYMSNVFALTNNERDTTKIINELNSLLLRKETNKDTNEVSFIIPTSQ